MRSNKWITIGALCFALFAVSCKKSSDPTPDNDSTSGGGGSTNDSANCIAGIVTDLSGFPYSLQPVFYPDGFWDESWNDGFDGNVSFEQADSCYANSYIKLQHKINKGAFGLSLLESGNWTAAVTIPSGGTSTKFSARVTTGYKFKWISFPDSGINEADSLVGDGEWHEYTTTYTTPDTQTSIAIPMAFTGDNIGGLAVGDTAFIEIRNLRIDN